MALWALQPSFGAWAYAVWTVAGAVLVWGGIGALRRRGERQRFDAGIAPADLTWAQFEGYIAEYFRRRGASVRTRGGPTADGGVDLVIEDEEGRRIVQAKHWPGRPVGVVPLRALWGVREDEGARAAMFVTSGWFTADATAFAEGKRLELIDGSRLREMVSEVRATAAAVMPSEVASAGCPSCRGGTLVKRLARRGTNAGSHFLGCSRFPECRYTAAI